MAQADHPAVLVTGGAGYIGAHTAKRLHESGYRPVVFDNLSSGFEAAVRWGDLVVGDVRDTALLTATLDRVRPAAVIHFAGLIEVGRSVKQPELFWDSNVGGTASLLNAMRASGVGRLVFSSTAAVYGQPALPDSASSIVESLPKEPINPYGDTKLACERMIAAAARAHGLSAVALRYFNACGADPSGEIGEAHDPETHLIPLAISAGLGNGPELTVFGQDFPTPDGSCVRDYIHVNDLAAAHVAAVELELARGGFEALNLGTGRGYSVLQVLGAVDRALGRPTPHSVGPRRAGDPPSLVANPARALEVLGWRAECSDLQHIVETALNWHRNPRYGAASEVSAPKTSSQPEHTAVLA